MKNNRDVIYNYIFESNFENFLILLNHIKNKFMIKK